MNHQFVRFSRRAAQWGLIFRLPISSIRRAFLPFGLYCAFAAASCFAASSPMAKFFSDLSAEATGTWAVAGAIIGLVLGLLGLKFGNRDHKGAMATMVVVSFLLLSVQGLVAYLQGE